MPLSKNDIKFLKSLQQKKFRDQERLFVVEGVKLAAEALQSAFKVTALYHTPDYHVPEDIDVPVIQVSSAELNRISGLKTPNSVLLVVRMLDETEIDFSQDHLIMLLDEVKDPGNLGTIIRTADWFGIQQIICSPESVDKYNPKVVQASMGAVFRVKVVYTNLLSTCKNLKENGFSVYGAAMEGDNAFEMDFAAKTAIVMGSESHGLSAPLKTELELISIPQYGKSESLNVAMAAGILMSRYRN